GVVMGAGDHVYDTLSYLIDQKIDQVSAFSDSGPGPTPNERVAGMHLRFSSGTIGWAVASSRTPYAQQPFEIHGTEGSLRIFNTYSFMTGGDDELGPRLEIANSRGKGTKRFPMTPCFRLEIEQFNRSIHGK